jgi:hypothetical protein
MKRASFLKSILAIAAAPKVLVGATKEIPKTTIAAAPTKGLAQRVFMSYPTELDKRVFRLGDFVVDIHGNQGCVMAIDHNGKPRCRSIDISKEIDVEGGIFPIYSAYPEVV